MTTLIALLVIVGLLVRVFVTDGSTGNTRTMRLMMVFTLALGTGVVSHFNAQLQEQRAVAAAEKAEAVAKAVKARAKLLAKYTPEQKEKVMAMFSGTYLMDVDRDCALALIISYSKGMKHRNALYEGCGFTGSDFIAMGVAFPHSN